MLHSAQASVAARAAEPQVEQHRLFDLVEPATKHRRPARSQPQPIVVQQLTLW